MLVNGGVTIYHKILDEDADFGTYEKWEKHNYNKAWFFGGKGAGINRGYQDANDVDVRIPYDENESLDVSDFAIGDIIVKGILDLSIETQNDLKDYQTYNITSINDNTFGYNQHIHIGGK